MPLLGLQSRTPIGLDIGYRAIKAVQLSNGPRGWRVEAVGIMPRPDQSAMELSRDELAKLDRVLKRKGFTGRDIVLAVPGDKLLAAALELPPVTGALAMEPIIRTEFCRAQKVESADVEIAHWEVPSPARAARGTHVMAAACRRLDAEALVHLFAAMDWQIIALDVSCVATARACAAGAPLTGLTAILDIGWSGVKLVMLRDDTVVFDRTLADAGMRTLQANIVSQLRLPEELIDFLLHNPDALQMQAEESALPAEDIENPRLPPRVIAEMRSLIRDHFDLLGSEVQASMSYASQRYPDAAAQQLLLVGGGADAAGAAEQLQEIVGTECRIVTPLSAAACAGALASQCTSVLTPASGLARFVES